MRNLHTHNDSGLELGGGASSIGRGNSPVQLQVGKLKGITANPEQLDSNRSFSPESKRAVMLRNLRQGMEFVDKQHANLHEMEHSLRFWRDGVRERDKPLDRTVVPETVLYLQTILRLSEEKLYHHPLFGSGVEQPIRIHLSMRGERFQQEIPVIPLHNRPGFCALAHSGSGRAPPSISHFDACETEFINALLSVEKVANEIRSNMTKIQEFSNAMRPFPEAASPRPEINPHLPKLVQWATRLVMPWRRSQAYAP